MLKRHIQALKYERYKMLETNKIYLGNNLDLLPQLDDESVDCIITSPPYDDLRTYENTNTWNFDVFKQVANELKRVLKKGGVIVWVVNDQTINGSETGSSFRQALYFQEIGLNIHDTMIWDKLGFSQVGAIDIRYPQVFDYMFIFSKGKPKTFNALKDRKNKSEGTIIHGTQRQKNGELKKPWSYGNEIGKTGIRFNLWPIFPKDNNGHPALFPEELVEGHILTWTNENDIVLDPFMGSGTTCIVAKNNKRQFIGFEIVEKYYNIAKDRLNYIKKNGQTSIFTDFSVFEKEKV